MKYCTLTEQSDGFGSQYQKLIYGILIAEEKGNEYVYRPVTRIEHNYNDDPEFINRIEDLMNLKENLRAMEMTEKQLITVMEIGEVIKEFELNIDSYMTSESLKKVKAIFWKNKNKNFFENNATNIAVHIRRPNEMDNRMEGTDTPVEYYLEIIKRIRARGKGKQVFHIYSQINANVLIEEFKPLMAIENIVYHFNESLFESFIGMVAADILVTSKSSFSYTAALLTEGTVYYLPFWHCPAASWIDTAKANAVFYYFNDKDYPIEVTEETLKVTPYTFQPNGELWEQDSLEQFFKNIDQKKEYTIVDIGAQSGLYSLFAKYLPLSKIYAFEPFPATFELLNKNLKLNSITNVITHNLAISDKIGTAILNTSISHNGLHTLGENPERFKDIVPIEVQTTTLDDFIKWPVDYIKIDTEGYEFYILKGGKEIIKKYKPTLQIEYNLINMKQCDVSETMLKEIINEIGYVIVSQASEEMLLMHKSKIFFSNVFENEKFKNNKSSKIKIDIGLSYSAPISEVWLSHEPELIVIGFEPNPDSVESILSTKEIEKRHFCHGNPIQKKYINERFFLLPCALSDVDNMSEMDFYKTNGDTGRSSLYEPNKDFDSAEKIKVPVFSLKEFFESFPFEKYEYIDYIKIDAQGSDINILKSAGKYLAEKVVYVTAEPEHDFYKDCKSNTLENITNYLNSQGFERIEHENTSDPTYINSKYLHLKNKIYIYQDG